MSDAVGHRRIMELALNKALANGWDFETYIEKHPFSLDPQPFYYSWFDDFIYAGKWGLEKDYWIYALYIMYDVEFTKAFFGPETYKTCAWSLNEHSAMGMTMPQWQYYIEHELGTSMHDNIMYLADFL